MQSCLVELVLLRYLHNKYKLNSDKTWVILPHFTIFLDYYFTCIFDAGSRSSPSPVPGRKKKTGLNRVNKNEVYNKSK